ncbi:MAG: 6-phosphofructokinase [Anaerolineae bacterium]
MRTLIVVSGGDAPGINALLFYLTEHAAQRGHELIGAMGGLPAVLSEQFTLLTPALTAPFAALPGSYLASSREPVLKDPANHSLFADALRKHRIDNLILFGGNGSLYYLPPIFAELGVPCVGIPTTIDNDVAGTDRTLGFSSACQFAYAAIDGIRATGHALPGRLFTLETLGGGAGMLALEVAYAAGADGVLLPEFPGVDYDALAAHLKAALVRKGHALLVYNEYITDKAEMLETLPGKVGTRVRDSRLGHAQRGAAPTAEDRLLARVWADLAYDALQARLPMAITVWRNGSAALHEGLLSGETPRPNRARYNLVNGITS